MKFDYADELDGRIVDHSTFDMAYPSEVDKAPNRAGVYIFIDSKGEVIYVGKASGGRLQDEIKTKKDTNWDKEAIRYMWFRTNSDELAKDLEADWIKKYQPRNNTRGK